MSHSRFRRTSGLYLDMHGLIFETSICYWQDQPGISFLTCLASVTRATIFQPALTQESRESPPLRELSLPKAPNRDKHHGRDFALPLSARPCNTPHSSHCQSSLVRRLEQKTQTLSLSRSSVWFFKDLSFGHGARDSDSFDRSFFVCFPTTAHHEYIERKLDRLGDGLRRDRPWR